jgi:group II intron reverse transcriptase/maturase
VYRAKEGRRSDVQRREACAMQNAETVLNVIRSRGEKKLPLDRLYRQLFNPELFLMAYGRIYANDGAMTPGSTSETVDGMSIGKITRIIDALRGERYRWSPARRTYIPKKNGKMRPLGMPTWSDKLVAEVVRILLDAYYDVQFSDRSHGFRPSRGCHTALEQIRQWAGTNWFVEGDISDFFGSLDHEVMITRLEESIQDQRFIRLVRNMLHAGYLEDWTWNATLSGAPQGGVCSPVLSNIYLDKLDQFVEQQLIPEYTRGDKRERHQPYVELENAIARARRGKDWETAKALNAERRTLPSGDPNDPGFRRLRYARYADDWLIGFSGPRHEAEEIKQKVLQFLRDELKLELAEEKTLITHAVSQAARFLGYEVRRQHGDTKLTKGARSVNGTIGLYMPEKFVRDRSVKYMRKGKPAVRFELLEDDDFSIVAQYGTELRGYVQYYMMAQNVCRLTRLKWVMENSMLSTLARKHKSSVQKMARKYKTTSTVGGVQRKCFEVHVERDGKKPLVARMGGIPMARKKKAALVDEKPTPVNTRTEIVRRMLAEECERCGNRGAVEVHHIRKLADINKPGRKDAPWWVKYMASRRRKTMVLCVKCHDETHAGHNTARYRS